MIGRSRCALQATRAALIVSRLHLLPPTSQPSVLIRSARFQMQRVDAMIRWMHITAAARGRACLRGRCLWQRLARNAHVSSRRSAQHAVVACAAYRWPAARAGLRAFRRALGRVSAYRHQEGVTLVINRNCLLVRQLFRAGPYKSLLVRPTGALFDEWCRFQGLYVGRAWLKRGPLLHEQHTDGASYG